MNCIPVNARSPDGWQVPVHFDEMVEPPAATNQATQFHRFDALTAKVSDPRGVESEGELLRMNPGGGAAACPDVKVQNAPVLVLRRPEAERQWFADFTRTHCRL